MDKPVGMGPGQGLWRQYLLCLEWPVSLVPTTDEAVWGHFKESGHVWVKHSHTYIICGCVVLWQRNILFPNKQTGWPRGGSPCEHMRLVCGRSWEVKLDILEPWAAGVSARPPIGHHHHPSTPCARNGYPFASAKTNSFQSGRMSAIHLFPHQTLSPVVSRATHLSTCKQC